MWDLGFSGCLNLGSITLVCLAFSVAEVCIAETITFMLPVHPCPNQSCRCTALSKSRTPAAQKHRVVFAFFAPLNTITGMP